MRQAFIGVDVGTSSARAGIFDDKGSLLATARHPITVWHEAGTVAEQSSSEIWAAWNPRRKSDAIDQFLRTDPPPGAENVEVTLALPPTAPVPAKE